MQQRNFYAYLFVCLCLISLTTHSLAQTITTGAITPSSICPGGNVSVAFTITGTYSATNTFSAQLSDAAGAFAASPPVIGSITGATAGTISATIPASSATGAYKIRVVSSSPVRTGSTSNLAVNVPAAPTATSPAPYCRGAAASALTASGQNLRWYDNANNFLGSTVTPNTNTAGTFIYNVTQTVNGCESPKTAVTVTVNPGPSAPGTSSVEFCQGSPASALTASFAAGATPNWYGTNATGGTASTTAPVPSNATAGTTTYYVSQTQNGCESPRASLSVKVKPLPGAPGVTNVSFCNNGPSSPLTANGSGLKWFDASDNPLGGAPTPGTGTVGVQTFKVSQTVDGCEGPKATLTVTISALPAAPAVSTPSPYCQGSAAVALVASGSSLRWYGTNQTGGSGSSTPTVPSTDTPSNSTYYVTQTVNGCESPRAGITVTVKATPAAPGVSAVDFCQNSAAPVLTASLVAGATPNWYGTNATGGIPSATAPVPGNTTVGTVTYYVSQTLNGCESGRAALAVRVKQLPAAPGVANTSFCNNAPSAPLTAGGSSLKWYDATDKLLDVAPTPGTGTVGDQTYKVSQTVEGCEGPKASITVTIKALPAAPVGNAPSPYCQGVTAAPLTANGVGLLWYGQNATGGTGSSVATVPGTATTGTTTYYVTQTVNGCESARTGINVTIKLTPAAPGVSAIAFCQASTPPGLAATLLTSATPNWYGTSATGGTASATAPVPSNTTPGTVTYYVSQTLDGCEGGRAALSVRVKPLPAAPGVANIGFCNNAASSQLTASGSSLKWYDATDKLLDAAPTPGTGTVGDQVYKVTQTVESCEGPKASITVTIKPLPNPPGVTNLNYCLPTQDQPAQNVPTLTAFGTELKWFNTDGNQYPSAPIPAINKVGTQSYLVSQTYNGCEGGKATLQVTIRTTAAPTVAKSLVTYCINDKAVPLEASAESGGSLRWVDPYGNVSSNALTPSTLNTSIKPDGDAFYVFQVGQNTCYSERAVIKVIVNALPTLSLTAPVNSVNLGQRANLQLKFTSIPPFSYTLTDGQSGIVNRTDTTLSLLPHTTTTYQIVTIRNSCGVGLPGNPATATITVRIPTVTTGALASTTLCAGTSLSVPFTTTGEFNQGNLFRIELVSAADTSKKIAIPATATVSPVTSPLPLTLVGGQYYVRVKADNPEIAVIGSNSSTLLTVRSQPTATLTGTQNIYEGFPANLTLTFGGESPWTVTYADSVRSYSATATTNPYTVEVRPTRRTTYQLISVANICGNGPVSGTATVTVLPLLGVEDDPLGPLVKTYPIPTTSIINVELDLPLTRTPATLSLTDSNGKSVIQQTTRSPKNELDLTTQPSGLYLLRIKVGDRQTVRKVLKQ
ncbi:T9SS type A sorting domain-containing protein [Spirosoma sp. KNUC1025]|uniref:Ig-like domain-containing protein n=1 Tax=Spirosoma sp. KNUC1025 TaxID=2894082 RepID=UPI003866B0CC|nr:T9SS type A sorting domain-containing protein [Spirosoma sp. KNUC1025]